jgi:polyribonucleotide nucleotidyltransferase
MVVAGTEAAIVMIEGTAAEVSEDEVIEAILYGHRAIADITRIQKELADAVGRKGLAPWKEPPSHPLADQIEAAYYDKIAAAHVVRGKMNRKGAFDALRQEMIAHYCGEDSETKLLPAEVFRTFDRLQKKAVRDLIMREGKRADGRGPAEVREITAEVGVLPRVHGSALFTRGETQALVTCTLGTVSDEQRVDGLKDEYTKKFMLDYNFPPFCVGEVKPLRAPSRREIGHGDLAERALARVMPSPDVFPYTVRIVSDILESNGSSSMASVCGATLCLMDAGVQIKRPVAGIAMGLVKEGDKVCILSDIDGDEDDAGDMDLKVAGTQRGITAIQMDLKVRGVNEEILGRAFEQAKEGRLLVVRNMLKALESPREAISRFAPRLLRIKIPSDKIGTVIGPGGKMVRKLQEDTKSTIEIEDDGTVTISSTAAEGAEKAKAMIEQMTEEPHIGKTYEGTVTSVKEFGCFVEILPGRDGLVHVSELSDSFVRDISTICKVGDRMLVKIIDVDDQGRVRLSRRAALKDKA